MQIQNKMNKLINKKNDKCIKSTNIPNINVRNTQQIYKMKNK